MARTVRRTTALPSTVASRVNRVVAWLADHGFTPANTVTLEVPGRRTGLPRKTVVVLAFHQGGRYLVSLAGESGRVRNVRASGGRAVIRHGRAEPVRLVEVAVEERAPILRAFLERRALSRSPARSARIYFGLPPHPSIESLAERADCHPVFRLHPDR
jgi:hypothetical protein